jgi:glycogen operon protein
VQSDHHLTLAELMSHAHVQLHGVRLAEPDRGHSSHSLAVTASSLSGGLLMHFALNAWWQPLDFALPELPAWAAAGGWRRIIDTGLPSPQDIVAPEDGVALAGATHRVGARSVVMLVAGVAPDRGGQGA